MPGLSANQVTLGEVLEVRGSPMHEDELWAVLYESCDSIKDIFLRGNMVHLQKVLRALNLDNVILCGSGKIKFGTELYDDMLMDRRFIAPERFMKRPEEVNDFGLEKMFVYTLGMVIYAAAQSGNGSVAELCLSSELETLLLYMCEDDPACRCNLVQVFQACNCRKGIYLSVERIKSMVKSILGSDLPLDEASPISDKLSNSSSILKVFSPTIDYSHPLPLSSVQSLKPLRSVKDNETTNDRETRNGVNGRLDAVSRNPKLHTHRSKDLSGSEECYEPLIKDPKKDHHSKTVTIDARQPVTEETLSHTQSNPQESFLTGLPPIKKVSSLPRDETKSNSTYSTPRFKRLLTTEKRKLANDGFLDENRSRIKFADDRYKSMPTLNSAEVESPRSGKESIRSAEFPPGQQKGTYRKLTRFASKDSMDSASLATSQYSSALSLNYGSYTLGSQNDVRRPFSFHGGSSYDGSAFNGVGSFERINEPRGSGPEFILFPQNPELSVVDISPARLGPMPRSRRKLSVMLPTAQRLDTAIEASAIAKEVFDQVTEYLGLKETMYFGLTQIKESEHMFLDLESKLTKYAPSGWKDDKKNRIDFILHFKVKFFIENVGYLRHYTTRHMFYLQLRREILCGYVFCPDEAAISLGSLALQAEFHDYVERFHGRCYFEADHYLPGRVLGRMTKADIYHQLPLLHHSYRGLREDEAEMKFLKEARKLREYGMLFYQVSRSKKDQTDSCLLGICVKGIILFEVRGQIKTEIHRQYWHMIKKFSFSRKKFVVEPKKGIGLPMLILYTSNYKKAKYLLRMCQSFHRFSQLYQPRNPPSDSGSLIYSQKSSYSEDAADPQKENNVPNTPELQASEGTPVTSELAPRPQEHGAISKFSARNGEVEGHGGYEQSPVLPPKSGTAPSDHRAQQLPRTLENDAEMEQTVQQMLDEEILKEYSPMTRRRLSTLKGVPERVIETIVLQRSPGQSLGITIVGGEDSNRLGSGIFIKNIISGGLVARNGRLQKGDRILSVNGTSLNQATHDEAAGILRNATGEIKIIASQFKSQGTSFLDQTGISVVSEDLPRTPVASKVAESTKLDVHDMEDMEDIKNLSLSPIATEGSSNKNPSHTEGTPKRSGKLTRDKVVMEDEIDFQEIYPEESHLFMEEDKQLNSTSSVGTKANDRNATESRTEDHFNTLEVTVRKSGNSFGMNITGGTGSPFDGIYVQSITPKGPVDIDGRIRVGDCLLHVNGVDITKVTHNQAVKVLQNAPVQSKLLISRALALPAEELQVNHAKPPIDMSRMSGDESSRSSKSSAVSTKDTFIVKIDKGVGGLGLSLAGGVGSSPEFKNRIMVKRLFPGQPAAACGKLRIGDVILAVNGAKVAGYTQQEAINLLRRVKQTVKILVKRPHPKDIPEELLVETPRETLDPSSILKNIQTRISKEAKREMPLPPEMQDYSNADQVSLNSYGHQRRGTDAEEIIPYPEKIATLQAEPNLQEKVGPEHFSPHEVLVHAQISGPKQRKVPSESGSLSGEVKGDGNDNFVAALSQSVVKNPVDETSLPEENNESLFEHEQLPLDFGEFDGQPDGDSPDEPYVVDTVSQDHSSHDLSLPNLPSAEEMAGLKLPDPVLSDSQMLPLETGNYEVIAKTRSETSSITDPDISSEEDGLILKIDPSKKKSLATDIGNDTEVNSKPKNAENSLLASEISSQAPDKDSSNNRERPKSLYFEVSLEKKDMGLGFILKGGKETTGCCLIQEIISEPALSCGQLQVGDEIVMVNSVDISKYEHLDAVEFLRKAKGLVKLGIKREFKSEKSNEKLLGYEMVTLEKNARGRHGLILDEENGEITVGDTVPEEPASLTGNLRHGDLIKEINDIPLDGMSLYDANTILEEANPIVQLAIQRKNQRSRESRYAVDERERKLSAAKRKISGDGTMQRLENGAKLSFARSNSWRSDSSISSSSPKKNSVTSSPVLKRLEVAQDSGQGFRLKTSSSQEDKGELIIVQLQKGYSGLGMSLTSHNDFGDKFGAFIANISPGGIAAKAGRLRSGDKVIRINGEYVEQKHQKEVVEILRKASGEITLEVFRRPIKLFVSMDRGSSIASSDQRDVDDLADMDFHFTEETNHADVEFEPDKLLLLLPDSNDEGAILKQDYEDGIQNQVDFQTIMKEDSGRATNSDFDGAKGGSTLSNKEDHKPEIGLSMDSQSEAKSVIESQKNSHQSIKESFKSNRNLPLVSENNARGLNIPYSDKDLSWNDSEVSDEDHSKLSEEGKYLGEPVIGKSSISTSVVTKRPTVEKVTGIGNSQEVSFSSTLEKVTPSSSVVSSTLGEISPVSCSDEENSDFEFSSSAIPDLSSFTLEDKEAFEKLYGAKEERKLPADEDVTFGKIEESEEIATVRQEEKNLEENTIEGEEKRATIIHSEVSDMDGNIENKVGNEELNFLDGIVADSNNSDMKSDSLLKGYGSNLDDSLAEDLSLREADSTAVLMALEEFEVRKTEEFNDTLKAQIDNKRDHCETSFMTENVTGEGLPEKTEENFIKQSPSVERKSEIVSKIPKLDHKQREKSMSPLPRLPGKSNIPILTSTKSKNNIELIEKESNTVTKPVYTETTFTDKGNGDTRSDKDMFHKFAMNVEFDPDSDNSFETDDDLALSLTRDTFSFGQEELDAKIEHFQAILNSDVIDREFQEVKDAKPTDSCDIARRSANRDKNRFRSILPFDKTRVCLAGGEEKDYINATHIKFETAGMSFHYIAAQGPLSTTVDDFWRMVWEQRVDTIVMVTKDVEGGKIKCHRYWPDLPGLPLKAADRFRIEMVHRKEDGNHVERQFSLTNTKLNKSFTINHLLFHAWPETGLPSETLPLLMFVKNSTKIHSSGPLLVHCSAGTGRTGLFIITDMLNKILPTDAKVDILSLVKSLKQQRQSLIQTKDQYIFCYKMAVEVLNEEKHLTY